MAAATTTPLTLPDIEHLLPLVIPTALHVLGAIVTLVIGYWLSGKAEYLVGKALARTHRVDEMLEGFFSNIARYFILTITVLAVLSQFGVQTTSLVAVIGAASLAIGLALQGTLSNLAAGVMLLIFRPFRIGHHIQVSGNDGTVKNLTLFWTEILTDANVQIIIPNSSVWGQALRNFSTYPQPAATTTVRIQASNTPDLTTAKSRIQQIIAELPDVAKTPAPLVMFGHSTIDNSLQFLIKFTATTGDADVAAGEVIEAVQAYLAPKARQQPELAAD